jgi:prophage antirepressor-like protein
MNEMKVFSFNEMEVRTVMLDGEPWWVAKDVCDLFGETNRNRAMQSLDDEEKGYTQMYTPGGSQQIAIVNESGLYSLLFAMQPTKARGVSADYIEERTASLKKFKKWVTSEVLPSIRKHGMYATEVTVEKMLSDPDFAIELLTTLKEERAKRIELEKTNTILMHVNKTYTATEIAKEIGLKSAFKLNSILEEKGIQFKQNETWVLYSKYADKGYTDIKQQVLDNGKVIYDRKWTQLGREFILKLLGGNYAK